MMIVVFEDYFEDILDFFGIAANAEEREPEEDNNAANDSI